MGIVAPLRSRFTALLTARFLGGGVGRGQGVTGGSAGFALSAKELLLAQTQFGFEFSVLSFEFSNALFGLFVHGLPVGGAAKGLETLGQMRANRTRALSS